MPSGPFRGGVFIIVLTGGLLAGGGCIPGPGPRMFPPAPIQERRDADGSSERWYDTNGNGCKDYRESYVGGRLIALGYDRNEDGRIEETVALDEVPAGERRHLILLLDSVSFDIVEKMWRQGRFRYCARPARVIAPFPVMTDLSFAEFFGASPSPGIESEYCEGKRMKNGYWVYAQEGNARWLAHTDYHMPQINHANAYLNIDPWFGDELRHIQKLFLSGKRCVVVGYAVGSSGMGAEEGPDGQRAAMITVDRMCQELLCCTRGRVRLAIFSDHGLYFTPRQSRLVCLREMFGRFGYRVTGRLRGPRDVMIPEFEMVGASSVVTMTPGPVARDAVGIEGVELAAYMEGAELVVVGKDGQARIDKSGSGFRYRSEYGDPLELEPILQRLRAEGRVDADGFVEDGALCEATLRHVYPDPVARLWRAFHGLVENTPQVILSLSNGYHTGSKLQTAMINMVGVHGNLGQASTSGFAMTSDGELPADVRIENLREAMRSLGVPVGESR